MNYNYKCIVSKNGKRYYKNVRGKWKRISNAVGMKAEKGKKKYGIVLTPASIEYLDQFKQGTGKTGRPRCSTADVRFDYFQIGGNNWRIIQHNIGNAEEISPKIEKLKDITTYYTSELDEENLEPIGSNLAPRDDSRNGCYTFVMAKNCANEYYIAVSKVSNELEIGGKHPNVIS